MKNLNLKKNKKGFTLVEIIVVLVIMGILLAIAVPSVMGYINKAQDQQYLAQARNGFLGAQTIVSRENATKPTTRSTLQADQINAEIGENLVEKAACTVVEDTVNVGNFKLNTCMIELTSAGRNKKVKFEANKNADFTDETITDKATDYTK